MSLFCPPTSPWPRSQMDGDATDDRATDVYDSGADDGWDESSDAGPACGFSVQATGNELAGEG